MSEINDSMKGHVFCDIERCTHNTCKRCDHLTYKDVDELNITDTAKCNDYDPKPPKKFNVTLNEDQLAVLMDLLGPSSDEGEPNEELCNKLYDLSHFNPVAANMWFINIYSRDQQYGGPEEGGWWYHTTQCEYSLGFDCVDWNQPSVPDLSYLLDSYLAQIDSNFDGVECLEKVGTKLEIEEFIREHGYFEYSELDRYGEGTIVSIERQPGAQHNMQRQHYE